MLKIHRTCGPSLSSNIFSISAISRVRPFGYRIDFFSASSSAAPGALAFQPAFTAVASAVPPLRARTCVVTTRISGTHRRMHPCGTIAGCQSCLAGPAADEPPNGQSDHNQHKCGSSSGKQVCGRESERRRRRRMEGILDGGCVLSAVAPGRPTTQPWAPICRLWTREKAEGHPESARCRERQGEGSVAGALRPLCCQHLPGAFDGSGRVAGFPPPCAPPCARGKEVGQNCHAARL